MTRGPLTASRLALAVAAGTVCLFISDNMSSTQQSGLTTQANARIGRPGTPMSVAGVARRQTRRAVRGAYYGGAAIGAGAYYGGSRYYGNYRPGGYYGAYAAGGYPGGYYGGYANRSYITGRPTLFPRYYGGGWGRGW